MASHAWVLVLAAGMLAIAGAPSPCIAQAPAADPILSALPADADNVFVLRDPLPTLEALLRTPASGEVLAQVRQALRAVGRAAAVPPTDVLLRTLTLARDEVPTEIVVAMANEAAGRLGSLMSATIAVLLRQQVERFEGDDATLAALTGALGRALRAAGSPTATAWVRARSERTAERWFDLLARTLASAADGEPAELFSVVVTDGRIDVHCQPLQIADGQLTEALWAAGVEADIVDGLRTTAATARIELQEDRLAVQLGQPAAPPLRPATVGPRWRGDPAPLLYLRLASAPLVAAAADLHATLADIAWPEEIAGPAWRLQGRLAYLTYCGAEVVATLTVGDVVTWNVEERLGDAALESPPPLDELLAAVEPDAGPFALTVDTLDAVGATLLDQLVTAEPQLYEPLEQLFEYVAGDESAVFDAGVLLVARAPQRTGPDDQPLFPPMALVACPTDPASARSFVDQATALLLAAIDQDDQWAWHEADLGLDVPTRVLRWQSTDVLHCVDQGPQLVLSTDRELTRALLARLAVGTISAAPPAEGTVAWLQVRGEHAADLADALAGWANGAGDELTQLGIDAAARRGVAHLAAAVRALAQHVDRCDDFTAGGDGKAQLVTRIALRRPTPK